MSGAHPLGWGTEQRSSSDAGLWGISRAVAAIGIGIGNGNVNFGGVCQAHRGRRMPTTTWARDCCRVPLTLQVVVCEPRRRPVRQGMGTAAKALLTRISQLVDPAVSFICSNRPGRNVGL